MKSLPTFLALAASISASNAAIVVLAAADISTDTNTTSFSNGDLTLTPLVGGVPDTFNDATNGRLGIDNGSNANAFNDPDLIAGNANDETLQFEFSPTAGLTGISWDFSRANGPLATDGVNITGFASDPGASVIDSITFSNVVPTFDPGTGTLNIQIQDPLFGGQDSFFLFANPGASAGQTLVLSVNDSTQPGAQLAITSISYDDAVPEPSTTSLLGLGVFALFLRRRR